MKLRVLFIVVAVFVMSCKSDKNKEKERGVEKSTLEVKKIVKDNIFRINIRAKVFQDDYFEVFYVDDAPENNFIKEKKIRKVLTGNQEFQDIELKLPPSVFPPYKFRLDLGQNKNQERIAIDKIVLIFNGDSIVIPRNMIHIFFTINEFLELDKNNGIFKILDVNGRRDPFIVSGALLNKKMEIEL